MKVYINNSTTSKKLKTNKWIKEHQGNGWDDWISLTCPVCGKVHNKVPYIYSYCPNCGTYMEDKNNEITD